MDYLRKFVIQFRGLSIDTHQFEYVVDKKFFEAIEYAELEEGHVNVLLDLINQQRMMILNFKIEGEIEVACDRCLGKFKHQIFGNERLIVKFGESYQELTDEVIIIPEGEFEIDISAILYEYIFLMLPMRRIHPDDHDGNSGCDQDMIEKMQKIQIAHEPDPRWDALKKLMKE